MLWRNETHAIHFVAPACVSLPGWHGPHDVADDAPGERAKAARCFSAAGGQARGFSTGLSCNLDTHALAARLSPQGHLGLCADVSELESPGRVGDHGAGRLGRGTAACVGSFALAARRRVSSVYVGDDRKDARGSASTS